MIKSKLAKENKNLVLRRFAITILGFSIILVLFLLYLKSGFWNFIPLLLVTASLIYSFIGVIFSSIRLYRFEYGLEPKLDLEKLKKEVLKEEELLSQVQSLFEGVDFGQEAKDSYFTSLTENLRKKKKLLEME